MPIYEYACPDCGHLNDHLQKLADAAIGICPSCGSARYYKKISAAGFALKGTGWYVTDFKNGSAGQKAAEKKEPADAGATAASGDSKTTDGTSPAPAASATPASTTAPAAAPVSAPAPAPSPAPASPGK